MQEFLSFFLPEALLDHFDIGLIQELGEVTHKRMIYHIHLTEKNELPQDYTNAQFKSKGFYKPKTIQDFPICGKAVYFVIKRRRWSDKITKQELKSDYTNSIMICDKYFISFYHGKTQNIYNQRAPG